MASRVDSTQPADGAPASKAVLRAALGVIRGELDHGGFAAGLTPTNYGPVADARVTDHLAAIDRALGERAGAGPIPRTAAAVGGAHLLAAAERADANALVVAECATDLEVPADARPGSVWLVDVATTEPVTVSVAGDVGAVNDAPGGVITAAGAGASLVIWVRANPGGAPVVRVSGDTTEPRSLVSDLDAAGRVITGYADGTDTGDLAGAVLAPADRGRVKVHTGQAGTLVVPDLGDGALEVINDGVGALVLTGRGLVLEGDAVIRPGQSARIRVFTGAGGARKAQVMAA